ncbi:MAG: helix-turn-helix domain-containing protein [Bacteroidaceae bacterium]|nr:helix-turn-helix domain-containing protein [Bacteroidaceae bacterium]
MKERLIQLMQLLGVNPTQFANQIGVQRATLQHILSGRNEASLKIVTGINQAYPSVNLQWLLYGQGQAIDSQNNPDENLIFPQEDMMADEFQNLSKPEKTTYYNYNNDKTTTAGIQKIKEVVVFFEDGTYKKFLPESLF